MKNMKRITSLVLAILLLVSVLPVGSWGVQAAERQGVTVAKRQIEVPDGYIPVYDAFDLYLIRNDMTANYILMDDIDLTEALAEGGDLYNSAGWIALGYSGKADQRKEFTGTLDGFGHKIYGLSGSGQSAGLFWSVGESGVVKNLTIASGEIQNGYASFATYNYGLIENCHNYASINKTSASLAEIGGIVYTNEFSALIRNCSNHGSVSANGGSAYAGGIVCDNSGSLEMVRNDGDIYASATPSNAGHATAGGIAAYNTISGSTSIIIIISNAYNSGNVTAFNRGNSNYYQDACAGGIVGTGGNLVSCYNTGIITSRSLTSTAPAPDPRDSTRGFFSGGITGYITSGISEDCTYCYFLNNTERGVGNRSSSACVSLSEALMQRQASFSGFNFTDIWIMGTGDYRFPVIRHTHELHEVETDLPTCTTDGTPGYIYCSLCGEYYSLAEYRENGALEEITKAEALVDALGHDWDAPTYVWNAANSKVTATRVCKRDGSHVETETVRTTAEITRPATCVEKGETTYTATFENPGFVTQTKSLDNIPATGHKAAAAVRENSVEPTCTDAGGYDTVVYCGVCNAELSRKHTERPALGHSYQTTVTGPTCMNQGFTAHTCIRCGDVYTDGETVALGHSWGTPTYAWSTDCSEVTALRVCLRDDTHYETETVYTTAVTTKPAGCGTKGETTYTAVFANTAFSAQSKTLANIDALGHSPAAAVEENRVVPTCTTAGGYDTVIYCTVCREELSRQHVTLAALGHDWTPPIYSWSEDLSEVTASHTCRRDDSHVENETVMTTAAVSRPASCTVGGTTTYTAAFTNKAFAAQTKTLSNLPALGHQWMDAVYEWSEDYGSVTATRICSRDAAHVETETVNTTAAVTKPATCLEHGETTYTAVFANPAFEGQTKVQDVAALGHHFENGFCTLCGEVDASFTDEALTVTGDAIIARPGATLTIPVMISGGAEFAGFTLNVVVPDGVTLSAVEKGSLLADAGGMFTANMEQGLINWTSTTNTPGSGELLVLTVVLDEALEDETVLPIELRLKDNKATNFADANEQPVSVKLESINITVETTIFGDVNSDTGVDTLDAIRLTRFLVKLVDLNATQLKAADVNHDNDITATDAIRLARFLVGLVDDLERRAVRLSQRAIGDATISVGSETGRSGETVKLSVAIENNPGFAGCTLVINTPEGITLTDIEKGSLLAEADGMFTKNAEQGLINWTGSENVEGDGEILILTLTVDAETAEGEYEISIERKDGNVSNFANDDEAPVNVSFSAGLITVDNHVHDYTAVVTAPTCTEQGYTTYTCTCGDSYVDDYVPALDHDWGEATYEWRGDFAEVTATRVCKRNESHVETETVQTSSAVTKPATAEEEGEIIYTAVFENPAFGVQEKAEPIPKLEEPVPVNPFQDVKDSAYYYEPVLWAVNHDPQITNGTGATTFSPEDTCTRGQVVTFLWRAKGCPEPTSTENPFKDVKDTDYFYKAVLWAREQEITNGTDATHFSPNDGCTRAQVVTFLWRAEGKPAPTSTENPFKDVPKNEYYTNAVLWAVEKGITDGTDPGKFSPNATCTRGQIVTFLYRDMA